MAGMGPPPKAPGTRARRNKAPVGTTLQADPDLEVPELPTHPRAEDGEDWHELVVEWWGDVWTSPMAPEYVSSDKHTLFNIAMMRDDFWRSPSARSRAEIDAEIRLQEQRLGLAPMDRRRLQWQIAETEEKQARGARRKAADRPAPDTSGQEDARAVLRAIK